MGFSAFLAAIAHPALRQIAEHWAAARGGKRMPSWSDIDPAAIRPHLPIVWSWKYDADSDSFTGRLAGEAINEAFGRRLRGAALKDFFADRNYEDVFERFKRIVATPAFMHCRGKVFAHAGRVGQGERIALPLSDDGRRGTGILGATIYPLDAGKLAAGKPAAPVDDERDCAFFALDGDGGGAAAGRSAAGRGSA